jgi:flavodoxin
MKTLIICMSIHHGNTKKIADAMADVLSADVLEAVNADIGKLEEYDLVGFGSGIYGWKHHKSLLNLIDRLPNTNRGAFIYSTRGNLLRLVPLENYHKDLRNRLLEKGFEIMGEFSCLGFDTSGPLRLVGGKNRGHPDERDLDDAREFAAGLKDGSRFTEIMGS